MITRVAGVLNCFEKTKLKFYQWIAWPLSSRPLSQLYHSSCSQRVRMGCEFFTFARGLLIAQGGGGDTN